MKPHLSARFPELNKLIFTLESYPPIEVFVDAREEKHVKKIMASSTYGNQEKYNWCKNYDGNSRISVTVVINGVNMNAKLTRLDVYNENVTKNALYNGIYENFIPSDMMDILR